MTQREIVRSYLRQDKYRSTPNLTLAKKIYNDGKNSKIFTTVEVVRTTIRQLKGKAGVLKGFDLRKDVSEFGGKPDGVRNPFPKIPKARKHFKKWGLLKVKTKKCLILSDVHIPYHDPEALALACEYGVDEGVDTVILNGDFADHFSCSFWEKDPRERDFPKERKLVMEGLAYIRGMFPKQRIIYKIGNHEERYLRYMTVKAPELLGIEAFRFENLYNLAHFDMELVGDKRPILVNEYVVIHGHEFYGTGGNLNPARGYYLKTKSPTISAHLHRISEHIEKDVQGNYIKSYSSGCLCEMHPDYAPLNGWSLGFVVITKGKKQSKVRNLTIENGEIC